MRKRFWQIGLGLALFIVTAMVMNAFQPADRAVSRKSAGHDFLAFYAAGSFLNSGQADKLYDLDAVRAFERKIVEAEGLELSADDFGPYWNPPLFAWIFAPLAKLPYETAWNVWTAINLVCFAGAMAILCSLVARASRPCLLVNSEDMGETPMPLTGNWKTWALIPLLTVVSMPFIQAIGHGQNTCISLLLVAGVVALWRSERALLAGVVTGLLFYKPQLSAVLALALVITTGWRAIIGLAITGLTVLITTAITLPGTLADFVLRLGDNVAYMQVEHRYLWERHVTLKAFWRLLIQGYEVGDLTPLTQSLYLVSLAAIGVCLFAMLWKRRNDEAVRDRAIAATLVAMPLLMPFYFDYDLLLLSIAGTLVASDCLANRLRVEKRLIAGWCVLFAWVIFNPAITGRTHVNGTVIALACVSAMMIRRAMKATTVKQVDATIAPETMRRAA